MAGGDRPRGREAGPEPVSAHQAAPDRIASRRRGTPRHELGRDMLATLAEKVLDLENQNLRYEHPI